MNKPAVLFALLLNFHAFGQNQAIPEPISPGSEAIDFKLKGVDGKLYTLESFKDAAILAIVFSAPHCPTAQAYEDRLIALQDEFGDRGLQIVMINPNHPEAVALEEMGYSDMGDSFEDMVVRAGDKQFNFPFLDDGDTQATSVAYGPVSTPHAFVFDKDRILRYAGRIDDNEKIGAATQHDLRNAVEAILAGREVPVSQTKTFGCSVKWKWKSEMIKRMDDNWARKNVPLENLPVDGLKELMKNESDKLRLVHVWATWCGPCVAEFDDLVNTFRMYMGRDFELYTISTDRPGNEKKVHEFLREKQAAFNNNYIFESEKRDDLLDNLDPRWQGAIPYTVIVEPGGKIIYRSPGSLNFRELRKNIVENSLIGRYY